MIKQLRRTATALAALAVIGGAGTGIASAATPDATGLPHAAATSGVVHTWFDPECGWGGGFNWHYYRYCDTNYWHGGHHGDWDSFDRWHHGYDYDRRH
jgi:hypothetical protein